MAERAGKLAKLAPVTDQTLRAPPPGDWLMWRRTYDGQGFSPLKQINRKTASGLIQAWSLALPTGPNEITPLVHDGVIFISSGWTGAGDRRRDRRLSSGTIRACRRGRFSLRRPRSPAASRSTRTRSSSPTPDRHVVALDVKTGKVVWDHEVVPASDPGPRLSGGPLVAHGKVIQGVSSCNNVKGGCFIVGLDAKTGAEIWRFQTIARPGQPGGDSWNGAPVDQRFGAAVWNAGELRSRS